MSYRYRMVPDDAFEQVLWVHCGHARLVWNTALEQMSLAHRMGQRCDWALWERELAEARNAEGLEWLKAGSSSVQQQALRQLRKAWTDFARNPAHFGRPRFRSRHRGREGFVIRDVAVRKLSRKWSAVHVPKCGWVRFRRDRPLGAHGMAHVTRDRAGRWHVSFSAPQPEVAREQDWASRCVGIDRNCGADNTIATTDREMSGIPLPSEEENARLKRLQRQQARQQPGSRRRASTKKQIAKLHGRFASRRKDWAEKTSTRLVAANSLIVFEDLRTAQMMRSASGTVEDPGTNVAAKSALNDRIAKSAWGLLERRVRDKAAASGAQVVSVPAAGTSQRCSRCGHTESANRPRRDRFRCRRCGYGDHADFNAADNILAAGLAVSGRGGGRWVPDETSTASSERLTDAA